MKVLLGLFLLPLTLPGPAAEKEGEIVERLLGAMGTGLAVQVDAATRAEALRASEAAVRAVEETEQRLSTWLTSSELSRLQAARGEWIALSPETHADLAAALLWSRSTCGLFDPCLGTLIEAWDLRGEGALPSTQDLSRARARAGANHLDLQGGRARLRAGARLDAGAFGKGAALDRALAAARSGGATSVWMDLGGQHAFAGSGTLTVELSHPQDRSLAVIALTLPPGSLATTGNSERSWRAGEKVLGHVIDPRSGWPCAVEHAARTVSVFAPSALAADALSTAAFLDLEVCAPALVKANAHTLVLEVDGDTLIARPSHGFPGTLRPLQPNVRLARRSTPH